MFHQNERPEPNSLSSERRLFEKELQSVLQSGNPEFTSFMAYIGRLLVQFHLNGFHEPEEIFNIAYCRGIKATDSGTHILTPMAWMRRTSLNIVRELSRSGKKADSLDVEGATEPSHEDGSLDNEILQDDLQRLYLALNQLNEVDRELLDLRFLQGLSWLEVGQCLAIAHEGKQTEAKLRQRGHRALKRLRKIYYELNDQ